MPSVANETERKQGLAKVEEVAKFFNTSRSHIYRVMDSGDDRLAYVKVGACRRIAWSAVYEYLERHTFGG